MSRIPPIAAAMLFAAGYAAPTQAQLQLPPGMIPQAPQQQQQQQQPTPPAPRESPRAAPKPAAKPQPKPSTTAQPRPRPKAPAAPEPSAKAAPLPARPGVEPDLAFGAFQHGFYRTAHTIATRRVEEHSDVKAMTLLGELYANGLGVRRDEATASKWYRLAADRGDREAMFALAMMGIAGRTESVSRDDAAKLLAAAAKLEHPLAAYNLGLFYLEGQLFPRDFARAAELFRTAADKGNPEAQYALATLYKEGRGVPKDIGEAARLLHAAARADNTDAQVEFAIAQFNGSGVARDEASAAKMLMRAARKGSPIAQNRLARILAYGRGMPANATEAIKWHLISKAGGASDVNLDAFMHQQPANVRAAAEKAAQPSLDAIKQMRASPS